MVQGIGGAGGVTFVAQYIGAGGNATLLTTMIGVSAWSAIESLVPVSSLDGTIYISEIGCWRSDDFPILKKALGLIYENHSKADADYETAGQVDELTGQSPCFTRVALPVRLANLLIDTVDV